MCRRNKSEQALKGIDKLVLHAGAALSLWHKRQPQAHATTRQQIANRIQTGAVKLKGILERKNIGARQNSGHGSGSFSRLRQLQLSRQGLQIAIERLVITAEIDR